MKAEDSDWSFLKKYPEHQERKPVRADSSKEVGDGLRMVEKIDPYSKALMYEFERAEGTNHKVWMDKHRQNIVHRQICINNRTTTELERQDFLNNWYAAHGLKG